MNVHTTDQDVYEEAARRQYLRVMQIQLIYRGRTLAPSSERLADVGIVPTPTPVFLLMVSILPYHISYLDKVCCRATNPKLREAKVETGVRCVYLITKDRTWET